MINQEGPGWRLVLDSSRKNFPVLIGGDNWAIELTEYEWNALLPLVCELLDQRQKLKDQLMAEESLCCELERSPWWACMDGEGSSCDLKLILQDYGDEKKSRGAEVYWPIPAAAAITSAMKIIWDSNQ